MLGSGVIHNSARKDGVAANMCEHFAESVFDSVVDHLRVFNPCQPCCVKKCGSNSFTHGHHPRYSALRDARPASNAENIHWRNFNMLDGSSYSMARSLLTTNHSCPSYQSKNSSSVIIFLVPHLLNKNPNSKSEAAKNTKSCISPFLLDLNQCIRSNLFEVC